MLTNANRRTIYIPYLLTRRQVHNETVANHSLDDYLSAVAEQKLKEAEKKKSQLLSLAMDWRNDKPESQERQCHLLREALNLLKEAKEAQKEGVPTFMGSRCSYRPGWGLDQ